MSHRKAISVGWFLLTLGLVSGCPRPSMEISNGASSGALSGADAGAAASSSVDAADPSAGCAKDEDCVPAICCHANACVPRSQAPNCRGLMCTMLCMPHTIDCGGGCSCVDGRCSARLSDGRGVAPAR